MAVRAWSWLSGSGLELDVRCELAQAVRAVGAVPITSWLSGWSWLSGSVLELAVRCEVTVKHDVIRHNMPRKMAGMG